jgi:hypothetical protein
MLDLLPRDTSNRFPRHFHALLVIIFLLPEAEDGRSLENGGGFSK